MTVHIGADGFKPTGDSKPEYPQRCTVELQWFEHLWNHENMFETGVVRANECLSRGVRSHNRDKFSIVFNMKVCYVFSLESPHRGDSNEYTQNTICNIKKSP